jgi:hypothetical protein
MAPRKLLIVLLALTGCTGNVTDLPGTTDGSTDPTSATDAGSTDSDGGVQSVVTVETGMGAGLSMPAIGDHELRVISPNVLELARITTKASGDQERPRGTSSTKTAVS